MGEFGLVLPEAILTPISVKITAQPGDMAVGIMDDTGALIGWSYLSGPAAGMTAMADPNDVEIFEDTGFADWLPLPQTPKVTEVAKFLDETRFKVMTTKMKVSDKAEAPDALVYRIKTEDDMEFATALNQTILLGWTATVTAANCPHLLGLVEGPDDYFFISHLQPPGDAHPPADPLGVALLIDAVENGLA